MNIPRRTFLTAIAAAATGLWLPSTRTIIDLNPQARPVDDPDAFAWLSGPELFHQTMTPYYSYNEAGPELFTIPMAPSVQVMIDGTKSMWFFGDDALAKAISIGNDGQSTIILRLHAPEHAPLWLPDERVKGVL